MNTFRACMSTEDTARWRVNQASLDAVRLKPDWFTRDEAIRFFMEERRLIGEFTEAYGVDDTKLVSFSSSTGNIFESTQDYDPAEG